MKEFEFDSHGAGKIHAYCWEPQGRPIGVVQIVHGISEHATRHTALAEFLCDRGFVVVAEDHMGHGLSHGTGELCVVGGWQAMLADCHELSVRATKDYPGIPFYLYGHSMGSFLTRSLLIRYPQFPVERAVICGTGWTPTPVLTFGRGLSAVIKAIKGEAGQSDLLHEIAFGSYCKKIESPRTPVDWVCSDPKQVDLYCADPMCGGMERLSLLCAMLNGIAYNQKPSNLRRMKKTLPVLFIAGSEDPVGNYGQGVRRTAAAFKKMGMENISMKLFPGRHEIHNEPNHLEIFEEIVKFLKNNAES